MAAPYAAESPTPGPEGAVKTRVRHLVRSMNRLRWVNKRRILQKYGVRLTQQPGVYLRYLVWDPEVESYSYALDNEDELCAVAARVFGISHAQAQAYLREAQTDPALTTELSRQLRWRFDSKTKLPLGQRYMWWIAVRATKPPVIVETGIFRGLGSLALLRALSYNHAEGAAGRLISVDFDPRSGSLVPDHHTDGWTKLIGMSDQELPAALGADDRVGLLVQDTPHVQPIQRMEFDLALRHHADRLTLIDQSGGYCPTLKQLGGLLGLKVHHFQDRPHRHFYPSNGIQILVVDAESAARWTGWDDVPFVDQDGAPS